MKTGLKGCLIIVAIIAMLLILWIVATVIGVRVAVRKYDRCDHAALLATCREMLSHRTSFTNSPNFRQPHSWEKATISLIRDPTGYGPDIPLVIRELNPRRLLIREDSLIIADPPSFLAMRRGVIAFAPDAKKQYGTRKYIDGLWYWDGNFQSEEMRNQVYGIETGTNSGQQSGAAYPPQGVGSADP